MELDPEKTKTCRGNLPVQVATTAVSGGHDLWLISQLVCQEDLFPLGKCFSPRPCGHVALPCLTG
jgi:hypothetical protein